MKNVIITIFLMLVILATCARGAELPVPGEFPTIQSAINAAVNGDTVIVAPGTYTGDGNRDIDFLGKAITVRSIKPDDPNIVAATIIDCNGTESDPHRGFYFHSGEDANSIVDGFTITNGYAPYGGGIGAATPSRHPPRPTINNCIISGNSADSFGGGIYGCNGPITNCTITGNVALHCSEGGGVASCRGPITNCTITDNSAYMGGGVASCQGPITNCTITGNSAYYDGGGLYRCVGPITNCIISNNDARIFGGGLASCSNVTNCTIIGNIAELNEDFDHDSYGGGISEGRKATNCIIRDNWPDQVHNSTVTYSNVQDGWPGEGNIDTDPCFVQPGYWDSNGTPADSNDDFWVDGDYHLKSEGWRWDSVRGRWDYDDVTSRCIDAGNPGSPLGDELLSVPDDPNNEWGQNLRIDMGAFGGTAEASIPPYDWALLADLTNDGLVDLADFAYQAADWLNSTDQQPGDLNRDSLIDTDDLALLVENWLGQTTWH
ncbi:MAG: hypothetical protein ABSG99_04390 [Sedimentisphaerales bacterium]